MALFRYKLRFEFARCGAAILSVALLLASESSSAHGWQEQQASRLNANAASQEKPETPQAKPDKPPEKLSADELDSLVAPVALYPDPMLAQVLAASTYPLEIVQLYQWLEKNSKLKGEELVKEVEKEPWDPSVQAMAPLPEVVKRLAQDIQWTTDLGNAFLAQQAEVMDAVQRMRKKAKETGNLKSSEQQKVETKTVESKQVIVIEQANPEVVYVPSYNPTVVYGAPVYPYPPIYYPPPGYYAAGMAISFGVGVAMGAAWGGGWGWGCGWGGNNVTINNYNNFNRNANINRNVNANRTTAAARNGTWSHNPQHRGGTPYSNRATADRYGGTARGGSPNSAARQANARQSLNTRQQSGGANTFGANRAAGAGAGGDRIGNRTTSASRPQGSAFGSGGTSGRSAKASSARGSASFGGGGRSRGGGRRR